MTPDVQAATLASAALVVGLFLRSHRYRRDEEHDQEPTPWWWVAAVTLGGGVVGWFLPAGADGLLIGVFCVLGIAAAWIDVDVQRIPNTLNLVTLVAMTSLVTGAAALHGDWARAGGAGVGAVGMLVFFGILARFAGLGLGDVKLAPSVGLVLGWAGSGIALRGLVSIVVLAGIAAALLLLARRARPGQHMPYAPAMVAGTLLAALTA